MPFCTKMREPHRQISPWLAKLDRTLCRGSRDEQTHQPSCDECTLRGKREREREQHKPGGHSLGEISVVEDDVGVLSTELQTELLVLRGGIGDDVLRRLGTAGE
jgi:hypothetical protein